MKLLAFASLFAFGCLMANLGHPFLGVLAVATSLIMLFEPGSLA